jgi:hypothetical protein
MFKNFTKNINDIIDKAVVYTNSWLLPNSKKNDGYLYQLTNIYDIDNNSIEIIKTISNKLKLIKLYSLYNKRDEEHESTLLEDITFEDIEIEFDKIDKKSNIKNTVEPISISENQEEKIIMTTFLVSLLNQERCDDHGEWMRVGWALHNIDTSLLHLWIDFSKRSSKFTEGKCEEQWYHMREEGLTIRSLKRWAEEDNYSKYHEYMNMNLNNVLEKSLSRDTYLVAKAFYIKYQDRFVCTNGNIWYKFKNHRWEKAGDGHALKKEISEKFLDEYLKLNIKYTTKARSLPEGDDKESLLKKIEHINKVIRDLRNITYKKKIIEELTTLFNDNEFKEKLDENYNLIGFNNGIFDLENGIFREGRPDDYVSMNTNVDYYPFNESNVYVNKMFKFFSEILPDEDVRKYFLLSLATCVAGHNREEKCRIVTGNGSNGKSLLFSLVQEALGKYYITCPITIITRKRNSSNQASPELARIKGARCGCFQETDDGEKLNVGILKEITGNDSFMVRELYSEPMEIKPQVKFFLCCNQLPDVPSNDGGTWRRIRVVEFNSKFVENPEKEKKNEFLIDNTLKQKIKEWAPSFASYLIHLYVTEYRDLKTGLVEPEQVKHSTDVYKAENDLLTDYFINNIHSGEKTDNLVVKETFEHFKGWIKDNHDNSKTYSQAEFTKFMIEKIGKPNRFNKWKGYKINVVSDDNDDETTVVNNALDG